MSASLKIGAVSFLNTEPLIRPLTHGVINHPHSIIRALPSKLAEMLDDGKLDCALAPVVTLLEPNKFIAVPEVALACRGAVASVLLFQNASIEILEKIWLDPSSRTSNLLIQVLRMGISKKPCEFILADPEDIPGVEELPPKSGRLVIGDMALRLGFAEPVATYFTDIGELWREQTGHPFVFARWIARNGDIAAQLKPLFIEARNWSILHLHEFIGELAEDYGLPLDLVDKYLRINITYMYGPREYAGEKEFFIRAGKYLRSLKKDSDV